MRLAVPASSANLGPGFDCVAVGLDIVDHAQVRITDGTGVTVCVRGEGQDRVPTDDRHLVVRSMRAAWEAIGIPGPTSFELECRNAVPHGRGLGSSATAIVTGVGAAYALHALATTGAARIDLDAVNDLAAELEGHPDNSSASVFGGLTLSWGADEKPLDGIPRVHTLRLRPHPDIHPLILVPAGELSTATARAVLPAQVPLADAAANSARTGVLVHAMTREPGLLMAATRDYLHQESRRCSYAESMALLDAVRAAGIAAAMSGAGPSVLVLAVGEQARTVRALTPAGWALLDPGFASHGAWLTG